MTTMMTTTMMMMILFVQRTRTEVSVQCGGS